MIRLFTIASPILVTLLVASPAAALDPAPFDKILRTYVKRGRVDYAGIKANAKAELDAFVAAVAKTRPSGSRNARKAFYFNAYNALVLKAVVDRWPRIHNVLKVKGFFNRLRYTVAGRTVTLNQLEKKVIIPEFKDVRAHFALVCAARSCPPLRNRAFRARGLDKLLDRLAKNFINGRQGVRGSGASLKVSTLFQWYAKDFAGAAGSVGKYLAKYHASEGATLAAATTFLYIPYNWALNKK